MALLRINRQPSPTQLGVFAAAWFIVFLAAGIGQRVHGHTWVAEVLTAAAVALPLLAWLAPKAARAAFLGLSYATYPVGFVLSYVVLAIVYFLVFAPVGLLMRALGRDPLTRKLHRGATSYWQKRPAPPPPESYLRQR